MYIVFVDLLTTNSLPIASMKSSSAGTSTLSPKELQIVIVLPGIYSNQITKKKHKNDKKLSCTVGSLTILVG